MPTKGPRHSKSRTSQNSQHTPAVEQKSARSGKGMDEVGFVVDLFLDKQKRVHLTQILDVKSNEGEEWKGWDGQRLIAFIRDRAGVVIPDREATEHGVDPRRTGRGKASVAEARAARAPESMPVEDILEQSAPIANEQTQSGEAPAPSEEPADEAIEIISAHSVCYLIARGEPFEVRLSLEDAAKPTAADTQVDYVVSITAHRRDRETKFFLASDRGRINPADMSIRVSIPRQDLEPGTYYLWAHVRTTTTPRAPDPPSSLHLRSRLLQVI
jgi:hypothetical protein